MRLSMVISTLVLAGSLGLAALLWARQPPEPPPERVTVASLLQAFTCRMAETKRIILRGVEDDYSPTGSEPNFLRPARQGIDNQTFFAGGSYDQNQPNRRFTDSIELPSNVARGLFVIRMKAIGENTNDTLSIGDSTNRVTPNDTALRFGSSPVRVEFNPGWVRSNDIYYAAFSDIILTPKPADRPEPATGSLLNVVRSGAGTRWIDVDVQDDTAVDVLGVAICVEPPRGNGLSMASTQISATPERGLVAISCSYGGATHHMCNPYTGDTACNVAQPVACFRPLGRPVPASLNGARAVGYWSGGELAFTSPVPGNRFRTIAEVDRFCAATFGRSWRTAHFHDGMINTGIAGYGDARRLSGRAWIDIKDQPYATCWGRGS